MVQHFMSEGRKIAENVMIGLGNIIGWFYLLFGESLMGAIQDVGGLVVTVLTIILLYKRIKNEDDESDE